MLLKLIPTRVPLARSQWGYGIPTFGYIVRPTCMMSREGKKSRWMKLEKYLDTEIWPLTMASAISSNVSVQNSGFPQCDINIRHTVSM